MSFFRKKLIRIIIFTLFFSLIISLNLKGEVLAINNSNNEISNSITEKNDFSLAEFLKDFLEKTKIYLLFPKSSLSLLASLYEVPSESKLFIPQPMKDLSTFNLAIDRYYYRPWETSGLVECEPWGVGKGISICLAPVFPGDLPCPIFMDCDGDGHYWFKGEDCDENCPTCYVGSKFYTEFPDGRDQDCDGLIDDNIECIPQFGSSKTFGYDSNCNFTSNTNYTLINEGEVGEIPIDEIHCQKRWGECTDYQGGFGNCTVNKTPGYFVKSNGVACGGGIFRQKGGDALFDCGKALRPTSYKGYYGCGEEKGTCCAFHLEFYDDRAVCVGPCQCNPPNPCGTCGPDCYHKPHPDDACFPGGCPINASFEYGSGGGGGGGTPTPPPTSPPSNGVPLEVFKYFSFEPFKTKTAESATQYGPWGLCHGYSEISCQVMTGCQRKYVENKYY